MGDCYCGLRTRANRWKWASFGVLLILGFIFLFAAFQQMASCSRQLEIDDCEEEAERNGGDDSACDALEQEEADCIADHYVLLSGLYLFWVMSWIGASVPLYIMCCCTERPREEQPLPEGMQMGIPHTFHSTAAPPSGYPVFPHPPGAQPVQGFLATPTPAPPAAAAQPADAPLDIPMYTATIK